jgi:hypothetical protein
MPFACALADPAERSENGAIPPGEWQPAHFPAKIGATLAQVGAPPTVAWRLPPDPEAIVVAAIATTAATATASAIRLRLTSQG